MKSQTYKYLSIEPDFTFKFNSQRLLDPKDDEVLIKVLYCGICATDIGIVDGTRKKKLPYLPGHEYMGIIYKIGKQVTHVKTGDRVVGNPNFVCGECYFCRQKEFELCSSSDIPHYSNGGFAEYLYIKSGYVYRVPDGIDDKTATLTECLACAIHAVNQMNHQKNQAIMILGAGIIGFLIYELLNYYHQTDKIIISEKKNERRLLAQAMGINSVLSENFDDLKSAVDSDASLGADIIFECSGNIQAIDNALRLVRKGGKIIMVGRADENDRLSINPCYLARNSIMLSGSSRYIPEEFKAAVQLLPILKHTNLYFKQAYSLIDIAYAYQSAREKNEIKTLVCCQ